MTGPARDVFARALLDGQELLVTGAAGGVGGAVADLRQADAAEHLLQAHGRPDGLALCVGVWVEGASEDACAGVTGASVMRGIGLAAGY